ncbi:hypothetical protein V2J09_012531 [Rumex salicifolius]
MAISVPSLLQGRKYPFIFVLSILFVTVLLFIFSDSPSSYFSSPSSSLLHRQQSPSSASPPDLASPSSDPPAEEVKDDHVPEAPISNSPAEEDKDDRVTEAPTSDSTEEDRGGGEEAEEVANLARLNWGSCKRSSVDYIPCLDNLDAIKALKSRKRMEHRERHCPSPSLRCLVPLPNGYKIPIPWPKSRDLIWYTNVPHTKLVEYKKEQNWVRKTGDYLEFPGGGTQFKQGVSSYIRFIEKALSDIKWGKNIRVILDVGCGVASFGGYLLDRNVITMSFAPKDEHEAQIQFALERGIPATLAVIGTQKLTFPDNAYDLVHCARCRVHWEGDGGKPLMELNRVLRPGGFFVWSATPVYRKDDKDRQQWDVTSALAKAFCWKVMAKKVDQSGIGVVIFQKPLSSSCYEKRKVKIPPVCEAETRTISWYTPLSSCLPQLPVNARDWPLSWPQRLTGVPVSLSDKKAEVAFFSDNKRMSTLVSEVYLKQLGVNWERVRNVLDMNAGYGGFAAALIDKPLWVMNVVPTYEPDTLLAIFDRGLIGTYHDWCESLNTYPRSYDLLHANFLFNTLPERCDIIDVVVEVDRVLRPDGWFVMRDSKELMNKVSAILHSLHWTVKIQDGQYLVGHKGFWRPTGGKVQR